MIYKHGTDTGGQHDANTVTVSSFQKTISYSEFDLPETITTRLTLDGVLIATGQGTIKKAIEDFETAYLDTDVSVSGLYHDDGATRSPHFLDGGTSISGVRVVQLGYPKGDGAEYATQRSFRVVLETVEDTTSGSGGGESATTSSFEESLSFSGGGPRLVALETISDAPVVQETAFQTAMTIVQSGSAVGQGGYPTVPALLFSRSSEDGAQHRESKRSPKLVGLKYRDYGVSWSYTFILASGMPPTGEPNKPTST